MLSNVWLFVTPWAVTCQGPLSKKFSRQEYWSGLPFSIPGTLPYPGIELTSPARRSDSFLLSHLGNPWIYMHSYILKSLFLWIVLHTVLVISSYINCISKLDNLGEWPLTPYFVLSRVYWDCMKYSVERWARLQVL